MLALGFVKAIAEGIDAYEAAGMKSGDLCTINGRNCDRFAKVNKKDEEEIIQLEGNGQVSRTEEGSTLNIVTDNKAVVFKNTRWMSYEYLGYMHDIGYHLVDLGSSRDTYKEQGYCSDASRSPNRITTGRIIALETLSKEEGEWRLSTEKVLELRCY